MGRTISLLDQPAGLVSGFWFRFLILGAFGSDSADSADSGWNSIICSGRRAERSVRSSEREILYPIGADRLASGCSGFLTADRVEFGREKGRPCLFSFLLRAPRLSLRIKGTR